MLLDWKSFLPGVKGSVKALADASPDTIAAYRQICYVDPKSGHLDAKTRELISLAVAVTTRSDGCIAAHAKAAIDLGTTREEIAEALGRRCSDERWCCCDLFRPRHGRFRSNDGKGRLIADRRIVSRFQLSAKHSRH
jgi:AhpD family alkylhydroperoxidase